MKRLNKAVNYLKSAIFCLPVFFAAMTNNLAAQELSFAHVITQGEGMVSASPDKAEVRATITTIKKSAKGAKDWVDSKLVAVIKGLQTVGINKEQLDTANLTIRAEYKYQNNQARELVGYRASRVILVKQIELANLADVLETSVMSTDIQIDGIELKSSKEPQLRDQARMAAIKDAKAKAEFLAKGFDTQLDGVWQIQYQQTSAPMPIMMKMESARYDVAESYQHGQISFRDSVQVIYKLK